MSADDRETMRSLMAGALTARAARLAATGCPHEHEAVPLGADEF